MSGALSKKFLESGVKKIFIIGLVPDVFEDYVNVKRLWMNCGGSVQEIIQLQQT